jgi:hypothetical protein
VYIHQTDPHHTYGGEVAESVTVSPPVKYFALFSAEMKECWLCCCGEDIVFESLFLIVLTIQLFVNWESIENKSFLKKYVGELK